jgi:hypothetical protein
MYALINNNKVISGPRQWNRAYFLVILQQNNIATNGIVIPRNAPEEFPFIINEDTKICEAVINEDKINSMVQYLQGPTWDLTDDIAIANYEAVDTPIEFAKGNFKELAKIERRKKEVTTIKVTVQDTEVTVSTDRDERSVFTAKLAVIGEDVTVNWKFPEGWLELSRADLLFIISSIDAHVQDTFDWEKNINDQIEAATTAEELLEIVIVEERENDGPNRPRRIEEE